MRVFAIRPEPGLSATIAAGRRIGLEIAGWQLFAIRPCAWEAPPPDGIDGLLLGSANAVRHGGPALALYRDRPVHAVGEATARAAREAGFAIAGVGEGGLQPLVDGLAGESLRLLRLAGAERVPVDPPPGIEIITRTVYDSVSLPMPGEMAAALREGALVLIHSAVAMRHLGRECARCRVPRKGIAIAALSPRIARVAGAGWARVEAAPLPREAALLALARDMCH